MVEISLVAVAAASAVDSVWVPGARLSVTYPPTPPSVSDLNFPPSFKQAAVRTTDWGDVVSHLKVKTPLDFAVHPSDATWCFALQFFLGRGVRAPWYMESRLGAVGPIWNSRQYLWGCARALNLLLCGFRRDRSFLDALQGECVAVAAPPGLRRNPPLIVFNTIVRE